MFTINACSSYKQSTCMFNDYNLKYGILIFLSVIIHRKKQKPFQPLTVSGEIRVYMKMNIFVPLLSSFVTDNIIITKFKKPSADDNLYSNNLQQKCDDIWLFGGIWLEISLNISKCHSYLPTKK